MTDGQARVVLQGTDAKEAEEERLEQRLREIMGDTQVNDMADIHVREGSGNGTSAGLNMATGRKLMAKKRSQRGHGHTTTSPIQESDMVKHYKSLFFARSGASSSGNRKVPAASANGYTSHGKGGDGDQSSQQRWTTKYKTNIVPPHMKRPKPQNRSAVTRKIQSSLMSSLPPEQIPSYFSAPALARMEPKPASQETEKKEGEGRSESREKEEKGEGKRDLGEDEENTVAKAELDQTRLELEEAKERLQLYQDQRDRIQELEGQIQVLNETKLDAKGMSVSMQRQLTQLTGERQEMLLELRDLRQQLEDGRVMLQKKDELMDVMKEKTKLLEAKGRKLERELVEVKSEIDAEREALSNTMQTKALKDAMLRIAELEALNHALKESIKQRS